MVVAAPVFDKSEPKSDKLFPYHLPNSPEWDEYNDWYSQTAMTSAAAGMFIKQPLIVWGAFALAVFGYVNQQPLRQAKDATSPILVLGMALAGVFGSVLPKMMLAPAPAQTAL
ncbi:hypothetical protein I350_01973 [Cryptococcus amylolentus CBS 6273]|uniref:Uncharacterized protein n=1 Tax=Cryptococcus amylolentus CBS 6273 TaxID=1296118 RepID=A0A1E3K9Y5_9TREE|nr:hypothetical protein I350_01973 [Cryptococcus amylolentus CBS 6273]